MDKQNTYRHPEWKRLQDAITPLLEAGRVFAYAELREMMDLDCRTNRGRHQFQRCAKEIAKDHQMQFECVPGVGYRVVEQSENTRRMHNRMGRARKRIRAAIFIGVHTRLEDLDDRQRAANADLLARCGRLDGAIRLDRRESRKAIVASEPKRLPHPLLDQGCTA